MTDEEDRLISAARGPVKVAQDWLQAVIVDDAWDAAWRLTHRTFRLAIAQDWLHTNRSLPHVFVVDSETRALRWAEGVTADDTMWERFTRTTLLATKAPLEAVGRPDEANYLIMTPPMAPDRELVLVAPQSGQMRALLVALDGADWRVMGVAADRDPIPGWPPTFPSTHAGAWPGRALVV